MPAVLFFKVYNLVASQVQFDEDAKTLALAQYSLWNLGQSLLRQVQLVV